MEDKDISSFRAQALNMAIATSSTSATTADIITRAKLFFDFIYNGGTAPTE